MPSRIPAAGPGPGQPPVNGARKRKLITLAGDRGTRNGAFPMARELDQKDIGILRVLAPECEEMICSGSGVEFRSILPPVANHYARDGEDFKSRLMKLTDDDVAYLVEKIRSGEESVTCVPPEFADILISEIARRQGKETALEVLTIYETADGC